MKYYLKTSGTREDSIQQSLDILLDLVGPIVLFFMMLGIIMSSYFFYIGVFLMLLCTLPRAIPLSLIEKYILNTQAKVLNFHIFVCNILKKIKYKSIIINEIESKTLFYPIKERPYIELEFYGDFRNQLRKVEYGEIYSTKTGGFFNKLNPFASVISFPIYGIKFLFYNIPKNGFISISHV